MIRYHRRRVTESLIVRVGDGTRIVIPEWMLDATRCDAMKEQPSARIDIEAMMTLRELLDAQSLLNSHSSRNPCTSSQKGGADVQAEEIVSEPTGPSAFCPDGDLGRPARKDQERMRVHSCPSSERGYTEREPEEGKR